MSTYNYTLTSSTQKQVKVSKKAYKPEFSLFSPFRLNLPFSLTQEQANRSHGSFAPTNIVDHIKQYRGQGRRIFLTLTRYWRLEVFRVSRRKIAQEVGCSVDTVSRWFTRFRKDLGIQIQQYSPYEVNEFILPDRYRSGKVAYEIGLLKLNDTDRKLRIEKDTKITHPETVVHKDIVLLRSIKLPLSLSLPTGRDTLRGKRGTLKKKNRERTPRQKRLWMIKRLLSRGQNSKAKELLYTPLMMELREKLGLTEREILKSTAFFDVVLRDSLQWLTLQQKNQNKRRIFDFKGLFFWRCAEYSKINKWKIEKYWYRETLRILYRRRIEMKLPTIKSLNLTTAGQVRLTCFSSDAIKYADSNRPITFTSFVRLARSWMEEQGEWIDYAPIATRAFMMGVRPHDPVVYERKVEQKNSSLQNDLLDILREKGKI